MISFPAVPRVIGHRGSARLAPENTLASIRRAHADGARWVEFDVKLTADLVPILMHDDTLDRTTNGTGLVADLSLARIAELDAGSWWGPAYAGERVPTFAAALHLLSRLGLGANVEIKACPGFEVETGRVVATALANGWQAHLPPPLLSSFSPEALEAAAEAAPLIRRGMLVHDRRAEWRELAARVGAISVHIFHGFVTPELAEATAKAGYPLLAYTVNDAATARRMYGLGACALFSDVPGYLLTALG
ncbi:MAG: glycerophosphodiester phosphodiesterase [Alphaproteobacteria bacterium]|nr:glycerophosphodiester phosphodiesterase [Alphaproteobacteria bacterium]